LDFIAKEAVPLYFYPAQTYGPTQVLEHFHEE